MVWLWIACAHTSHGEAPSEKPGIDPAESPISTHFVLRGAEVVGLGRADVEVNAGTIVAVGLDEAPDDPAVEIVDVTGRFLMPAFIDSHVHLAYLPEGEALADGGVAAAVDLAAPIEFLAADHGSLTVLGSGPMVTAVGGYPTASWGRDGYGLTCADLAAAVAAVSTLADAGARVIKLPVTDAPCLDDNTLAAVVSAAHARGLKVVSHALYAEHADRAAAAGVDVLAHMPVELLPPESVAAWSGRAVVATLRAFGDSASTRSNLAALRAAGVTVLYGTDFGNTRALGIDTAELDAMRAAGMDPASVLAAATSVPSGFWGLDEGFIAEGRPASLLVLGADPTVNLSTLGEPEAVFIRGIRR